MNPEIQPTSPLDLAGVVVAAPAAGPGENGSTRMPRRRPHLSRVYVYAAAVGLGQGHDICREAVWPIRGVSQVQPSGGFAVWTFVCSRS